MNRAVKTLARKVGVKKREKTPDVSKLSEAIRELIQGVSSKQ